MCVCTFGFFHTFITAEFSSLPSKKGADSAFIYTDLTLKFNSYTAVKLLLPRGRVF